MSSFNDFRFKGLNHRSYSNQYLTMDRVSADESRIIVRVANCHIFQTMYGYGLVLDRNHVLWLKSWAASINFKGNEVMLSRDYFKPETSKRPNEEFDEDEDACTWEHWLAVAKEQEEAGTAAMWRKDD